MRFSTAFGILFSLVTANATPLLVPRIDECNPGGGSHGGGAVIPSYCYSSVSLATSSVYASPSDMAPSSTSKCLPSTTSTYVTDPCNPGGGSHGGGAILPSYCYSSASASTSSAYVSPSNMAPSSTSKCLPSTTSTYVTDPCNPGGGSHGGGAVLPSYCFSSTTSVVTSAYASPSDQAPGTTSKCPSVSPSPTSSYNPGGGDHGGGAGSPMSTSN
ncbi:hypothetical protein A1Q2_06731 [Trichosporon asahii var. asahii CBS 8904]|uniref:Uncharacterized protein n=1 Tax=Trichosporon asahii var. asahii (strain CBS 8904) TaxID=1220162 RepID=K1VQG4_TRIAC|nr:hypothetical protein A1Q2_06731 [Trichosporon asahii var. asahii CBS 8904]